MRLRRGGKPGGLGRVESVAFDVAVELAGGKGPLGRERWDGGRVEVGAGLWVV